MLGGWCPIHPHLSLGAKSDSTHCTGFLGRGKNAHAGTAAAAPHQEVHIIELSFAVWLFSSVVLKFYWQFSNFCSGQDTSDVSPSSKFTRFLQPCIQIAPPLRPT